MTIQRRNSHSLCCNAEQSLCLLKKRVVTPLDPWTCLMPGANKSVNSCRATQWPWPTQFFFWSSVDSKTKKIDSHTRSLECQVPDLGKIMEDLRNLLFHSNPSIISSTPVQYQWHAESFVNAFGQDLALAAIMVSGNETVTCLHWWITKS